MVKNKFVIEMLNFINRMLSSKKLIIKIFCIKLLFVIILLLIFLGVKYWMVVFNGMINNLLKKLNLKE